MHAIVKCGSQDNFTIVQWSSIFEASLKFVWDQLEHMALEIIGASLSEPHTSVTALRTRVSIYPTMDRPLTGNFKSADLRNLYVHVCTSNSNLILKLMIMEFSRSSSTTVDLLSARERLRLAHRQYKSRQ